MITIIAETHLVIVAFGVTLLTNLRDGKIVSSIQLRVLAQKNAVEPNVMDTEVVFQTLRVERIARNGLSKLLINMEIHHKRNQIRDSVTTITAETQMVKRLSGATLMINPRDGNTVNQRVQLRVLVQKNAVESNVLDTEVV